MEGFTGRDCPRLGVIRGLLKNRSGDSISQLEMVKRSWVVTEGHTDNTGTPTFV